MGILAAKKGKRLGENDMKLKLTNGSSYSESLYGRLGVFYHRMTKRDDDPTIRQSLCSPETWSNIVEWDLINDPLPEKICPRCIKLLPPK